MTQPSSCLRHDDMSKEKQCCDDYAVFCSRIQILTPSYETVVTTTLRELGSKATYSTYRTPHKRTCAAPALLFPQPRWTYCLRLAYQNNQWPLPSPPNVDYSDDGPNNDLHHIIISRRTVHKRRRSRSLLFL
jgi:hypothetical protein